MFFEELRGRCARTNACSS